MDEQWRSDLAQWAIPDEIVARAPENPWGHSPARFAGRTDLALAEPEGPTLARTAEALPAGGTVLDVGAGAGAASLPLAGSLGELIAVDPSADMLAELTSRADALGVPVRTVRGRWPDVAAETPVADVAVAAHVVYNVPDLAAFLTELSGHARRRVVLELTERHPMSWLTPLWEHFHGLRRPERPTAHDVIAVAEALGHEVRHEWRPAPLSRFGTLEELAESACRRLCLGQDRAAEVIAAVVELDMWPLPRERWFTLWWESEGDPQRSSG
ncbi:MULTISPECIES: class I SAM-dependent methyltransferase [Streptosporangium]|uniref:2-polyprenyl-3-methyl-5-hydroxy-6-metoxy-1, 4-benzoquinol methylase n=1 Tax=Streptosporangium brasiliense TaxID=47480 RepID=A0ABT9R6X6_9ACTN|nr:class I SAM-dependent methyltransferase [Streptosporangium brasiliense]MDP9864621.1 2-polyprenyl-3-methyl-5-hydroxy-6-metoxy-1,4-benzoquinol methylase [Streptosporangium brasiliense]